eukprot:TRINITY_DN7783_c0_g6_i1.p1 TRINITY_DN7783_c0_g6~~TRINITY_DN7783_c0_g6_i1.p1  ORF type:complete len:481 (-),score=105.72 TRINITY_DN7783_c0_g6_i1:316-1758(-)
MKDLIKKELFTKKLSRLEKKERLLLKETSKTSNNSSKNSALKKGNETSRKKILIRTKKVNSKSSLKGLSIHPFNTVINKAECLACIDSIILSFKKEEKKSSQSQDTSFKFELAENTTSDMPKVKAAKINSNKLKAKEISADECRSDVQNDCKDSHKKEEIGNIDEHTEDNYTISEPLDAERINKTQEDKHTTDKRNSSETDADQGMKATLEYTLETKEDLLQVPIEEISTTKSMLNERAIPAKELEPTSKTYNEEKLKDLVEDLGKRRRLEEVAKADDESRRVQEMEKEIKANYDQMISDLESNRKSSEFTPEEYERKKAVIKMLFHKKAKMLKKTKKKVIGEALDNILCLIGDAEDLDSKKTKSVIKTSLGLVQELVNTCLLEESSSSVVEDCPLVLNEEAASKSNSHPEIPLREEGVASEQHESAFNPNYLMSNLKALATKILPLSSKTSLKPLMNRNRLLPNLMNLHKLRADGRSVR